MSESYEERTLTGAVLALLGGVLMGGVGVVGKFGADASLSPFLLLAAQVSLLVPVAALSVYFRHGRTGFVPVRGWILGLRAFGGLLYFLSFYGSLKGISVADALVLESTNPFFALVIGQAFLGERMRKGAVAMLVLAFAGVCMILIHHAAKGLVNPYSLLALLAGFGRALGSTATRVAGETEPPERIIFYFAAGTLIFTLAVLPAQWTPVPGGHWWILLALALMFMPQNLLYTISNRLVPAYVVGALFYSAILVGVIADYFIWSTVIEWRGAVGMVFVIASGLGLVWLRSRERTAAMPARE